MNEQLETLRRRVVWECDCIVANLGPDRIGTDPVEPPQETYNTVRAGDGKRAEALAAVMYWTGPSFKQALAME